MNEEYYKLIEQMDCLEEIMKQIDEAREQKLTGMINDLEEQVKDCEHLINCIIGDENILDGKVRKSLRNKNRWKRIFIKTDFKNA